ncbi:uncharacterized protein LOC111622448 isoform X1 [Centruroides sculpturatus]|uniref:uncharacterized protein LOC111622448 isoform X1 n=1 Tax=Centruroides sculpturatus TaxID=218467 RepID=UPI000C6CE9F3|nr:uncharacterized protein LOC111622448 isoform X1 [Centruroides sculpturatus]
MDYPELLQQLVYGNYCDCNVLSNVEFPLIYKLKILNFMKRFARFPIGLNFRGFFFIKKTFVIRVISAIYSLLNSLIELERSTNMKKCRHVLSKNGNFSEIHREIYSNRTY